MARRSQLPAMQLAGLALLCSVLCAATFFLPESFGQWLHAMGQQGRLLSLAALFIAFVSLLLMSWKAETRFKNGVENGQWSEEELALLRNVLTSPWWTAFCVAILFGSVIAVIVTTHQYRGMAWPFLIVGRSLSSLRLAVQPRRPKNPMGLNWTNFAPIRSEHWGER
jgi:hypothetical protein